MGRPARRLTGPGLALVVVVAVLAAWLVLGGDPYVAPDPDQGSPGAGAPTGSGTLDTAGAGAVLARLERAVAQDAPADARALAPRGSRTGDQLRAVVDNAARLEVADLSLRYVAETGPVSPDGSWQASVELTWRFAGYDQDPARTEVRVGFAPAEDGVPGVQVVRLGGGPGRTPVWLTGPVTVASSPTTLVLAAGRRPAARYEPVAQRAVDTVDAVLTRWRPRLVVEVPADERGLDAALETGRGTNAQIAGVTAAVDGRVEDSPIHVFLNPDVYDGLGRQGAQVVMSHEAVHVATRAPSSALPVWLSEGFADYVALGDVDLPFSVTAGQVAEEVRRDGLPRALPGAAEFDTADARLGAAYEAAWVACLVLDDRGGQDDVVAFYDAVDGGSSVDQALRELFGWSEDDLVRAWRQRLADLADLAG